MPEVSAEEAGAASHASAQRGSPTMLRCSSPWMTSETAAEPTVTTREREVREAEAASSGRSPSESITVARKLTAKCPSSPSACAAARARAPARG